MGVLGNKSLFQLIRCNPHKNVWFNLRRLLWKSVSRNCVYKRYVYVLSLLCLRRVIGFGNNLKIHIPAFKHINQFGFTFLLGALSFSFGNSNHFCVLTCVFLSRQAQPLNKAQIYAVFKKLNIHRHIHSFSVSVMIR